MSRKSTRRQGAKVRLSVENLESRTVPAVHVWSGADAANNANWSNAANWSIGGAPAPGETDVEIQFNAGLSGSALTSNNDLAFTNPLKKLQLDAAVTVNGTGFSIRELTGAGNASVNVPLTLAQDQTWNSGATDLNLNQTITLNGFKLTLNGVGVFDIAGKITGTGEIVTNTSGPIAKVIFSGANDYLGKTTIRSLFVPQSPTALGATGAGNETSVERTVEINGNQTIAEPMTFRADTPIFVRQGKGVFTGDIDIGNFAGSVNVKLGQNATVELAGKLTGQGFLEAKLDGGASVGTLTIAGTESNTFSGGLFSQQGVTIELAKSAGKDVVGAGGGITMGLFGNGPVSKLLFKGNNQLPESLSFFNINPTGAIDLNGFADSVVATNLTISNAKINLPGASQLTVSDDARVETFNGFTLGGTGSFNFAGPGTFVIGAVAGDFAGTLGALGGELRILRSLPKATAFLDGGKLSGNATLARLRTGSKASVLAPGTSPGTINFLGTPSEEQAAALILAFVLYEMEVFFFDGGTSPPQRDRVSTPSVELNNPELDLKTTGTAPMNQEIEVIQNTGTQPINGTFKGLPEGATFTANNQLFQITYKGGDGNDAAIKRVDPNANVDGDPALDNIEKLVLQVLGTNIPGANGRDISKLANIVATTVTGTGQGANKPATFSAPENTRVTDFRVVADEVNENSAFSVDYATSSANTEAKKKFQLLLTATRGDKAFTVAKLTSGEQVSLASNKLTGEQELKPGAKVKLNGVEVTVQSLVSGSSPTDLDILVILEVCIDDNGPADLNKQLGFTKDPLAIVFLRNTDLATVLTGPATAAANSRLTYRLNVKNASTAQLADDVVSKVTLPEGVDFVSAVGGQFDRLTRTITFKLGDIAKNAMVSRSFVVRPIGGGDFTLRAASELTGVGVDAVSANNTASVTVKVSGDPILLGAPTASQINKPVRVSSSVKSGLKSVKWFVTQDGKSIATGTGVNFTFTPKNVGQLVVTMEAIKGNNQKVRQAKAILVLNVATKFSITADPTSVRAGNAFKLIPVIPDPAAIDTLRFDWKVEQNGRVIGTGLNQRTFLQNTQLAGLAKITLTVTDTAGKKTVVTKNVNVLPPASPLVTAKLKWGKVGSYDIRKDPLTVTAKPLPISNVHAIDLHYIAPILFFSKRHVSLHQVIAEKSQPVSFEIQFTPGSQDVILTLPTNLVAGEFLLDVHHPQMLHTFSRRFTLLPSDINQSGKVDLQDAVDFLLARATRVLNETGHSGPTTVPDALVAAFAYFDLNDTWMPYIAAVDARFRGLATGTGHVPLQATLNGKARSHLHDLDGDGALDGDDLARLLGLH